MGNIVAYQPSKGWLILCQKTGTTFNFPHWELQKSSPVTIGGFTEEQIVAKWIIKPKKK